MGVIKGGYSDFRLWLVWGGRRGTHEFLRATMLRLRCEEWRVKVFRIQREIDWSFKKVLVA